MPFADSPDTHSNFVVLPKMVLNVEQRQTIIVHMHCTSDNLFWMSHAFKAIRFHELFFTGFTEITLFCFNISFAFAILDKLFRMAKHTIFDHGYHL